MHVAVHDIYIYIFFFFFFFFNSEEISSRLSPTSETLILRWPEMVQKIILQIVS